MAGYALDIETIRDPAIARVAHYWFKIRRDRMMPSRVDIDPTDITDVLPLIWLAEFDAETRRFRYRLAGERVREAYTESISGRFLDQFTRESAMERVSGYFEKAVDLPCIVHVHGKLFSERERPARGERILLPLSSDGVHADGLFGATAVSWDNITPSGDIRYPTQHREFHPLDGSAPFSEQGSN